jgi:hypothetical protein
MKTAALHGNARLNNKIEGNVELAQDIIIQLKNISKKFGVKLFFT